MERSSRGTFARSSPLLSRLLFKPPFQLRDPFAEFGQFFILRVLGLLGCVSCKEPPHGFQRRCRRRSHATQLALYCVLHLLIAIEGGFEIPHHEILTRL